MPSVIEVLYKDQIIVSHMRSFQRDTVTYDPWHYIDALKKKPGALRDGAPFKHWDELPASMMKMRQKMTKVTGGDKAFVSLLCAVSEHGLDAVSDACKRALDSGIVQADWILNHLFRAVEQPELETVQVPQSLKLKTEPIANCNRYDALLGVSHAIH